MGLSDFLEGCFDKPDAMMIKQKGHKSVTVLLYHKCIRSVEKTLQQV